MKIATWNLDHRAGNGRRHDATVLVDTVGEIGADVSVLTEYVPRMAPGLPEALQEAGFASTLCKPYLGSGNYVLVASKTHAEEIPGFAPQHMDQDAVTNVLCARLPATGMTILGLRVPAYEAGTGFRRRMWEWIEVARPLLETTPAVMIGDFNVDPGHHRALSDCPDCFRALAGKWTLAAPVDGASYWAVGKEQIFPRRLDHAFVNSHVAVSSAVYITRTPSHVLVDPEDPRSRKTALSDHAALVIQVEPTA